MGHSSLAITMKVYNHVDDKRMCDEIEKFDEKLNRDSRALGILQAEFLAFKLV